MKLTFNFIHYFFFFILDLLWCILQWFHSSDSPTIHSIGATIWQELKQRLHSQQQQQQKFSFPSEAPNTFSRLQNAFTASTTMSNIITTPVAPMTPITPISPQPSVPLDPFLRSLKSSALNPAYDWQGNVRDLSFDELVMLFF